VGHLHRVEELRSQVGDARISIQQMVAFVPEGGDREAAGALANRRFGYARPTVGTATELVDHYGRLGEQGVERVYTWFCDFAPPETLQAFAQVIAELST
jgi:hypothetical protein